MEIHKAIWMNLFLYFTKIGNFFHKKKQPFQKNGPNMVHATPPTPPQPKPPWCPWRIETSVGWWLKNSPSHWKNMRRIVKLHENRNPKRSGWKFHQKILELPDTYAIALTLPVVKTKAVLDTAFERPKRPNGSLSAWVQLMLPCVMTSMSKNLAGPILQWGPLSTHLENSDSKNPPPTTLATHPPDFDKLQPFQRIFTSSEAQTARFLRKSWTKRGARNHGSKTNGSTGAVLSSVGAAPVQLKDPAIKAPWMAVAAEMDGRTRKLGGKIH